MVDLRTGQLNAATPDQHITKIAVIAPGDGAPVLWLRFLREAVGGDADKCSSKPCPGNVAKSPTRSCA